MEREVVVRGEAEVWVMPDRAEVGITVEADGGTRDGAWSATLPTRPRRGAPAGSG